MPNPVQQVKGSGIGCSCSSDSFPGPRTSICPGYSLTPPPHPPRLQTINAGEGVEKREPSYTAGGNINWYNYYGEQHGSFLKELNIELPYIQQFHSWAYIWRKPQFKLIHVPQCSMQHYLQQPRHRSNINAHQQRNGQLRCGKYIQRTISQP